MANKIFYFKKPCERIEDENIQIIFKTSCGCCPGLVLPKLALQKLVITDQGDKVDEIYFGTCVKKGQAIMNCPMNLEPIKAKLEDMFGVPVTVGTHDY